MVFIDPPGAERLLRRISAPHRRQDAGRRAGLARAGAFAGPTVLAAVAYLDPGNFATNITAGATCQYRLLWVVALANVLAMVFQALAAKLGIVTGRSLPQLCRERLPRHLNLALWGVSEVGAIATDFAELLGASLGCALLLGTSLLVGTLIAGALSWAILVLHDRSFAAVAAIIAVLIGVVGLCFIVETGLAPPDWRQVLHYAVTPSFGGPDGVMLAAGIVGATLMPHALFLHSSIARNRLPASDASALRRLVRASNIDIGLTLGAVSLVNMAILCAAAVMFGRAGAGTAPSIAGAYRLLGPLFGGMSAAVFMVSLLASGLSSSVVGTMAGQVIMQEFVDWRIPLWVRRLATMLPTLVVAAFITDVTRALVVSQVVLSLVLPVPLVALLVFTGNRSLMGSLANSHALGLAAGAATAVVLALNAFFLATL